MKPILNLSQNQRLNMTPLLQQGIKILQMSTAQLNEEVILAVERNPMLEIEEGVENSFQPSYALASDTQESAVIRDASSHFFKTHQSQKSYNNMDIRGSARILGNKSASTNRQEFLSKVPEQSLENQELASPGGVQDYLLEQAAFLFSRDDERQIAFCIIKDLNDAGYVQSSLQEIQRAISDRCSVGLVEIEQVLSALQTLEPTGIAARNPRECLLLQLDEVDASLPEYDLARVIVHTHLDELAYLDRANFSKQLNVSLEALEKAVAIIQRLNPYPGYKFSNQHSQYIVPDILVEKINDSWQARLSEGLYPRVSINSTYQDILNQNQSEEFDVLKEQLKQAKWLLSNIEKRNETILKVAQQIVSYQQSFFEQGIQKILPLSQKEIAQSMGVHASTVSRTIRGKYLSAPQGVFKLKYFFSASMQNKRGEVVSIKTIQAEMLKIIQNESPSKPVSDQKISLILEDKGYRLARRTIAQYRERVNIPSSRKRKTLKEVIRIK